MSSKALARIAGEFDIVTKDADGYVFYEVKFRKNPLPQALIEEEAVKQRRLSIYI